MPSVQPHRKEGSVIEIKTIQPDTNLSLCTHCRPDKAQRVRRYHKDAVPIQVLSPAYKVLRLKKN
ncbi:MAG: hypothetical protein WCQ99_03670 [Pseudomonadota bacterium]